MATVITDKSTTEVVLESPLETRYALRTRHAVIIAIACMFFLVLNYLPLRATDLWGHVAYGQWILQNGSLPTEDPMLKLAEGMPVIDSAWLSQVIFAAVENIGAEALSNLFALTLLVAFVLLARGFYLQSRNTLVAVAGAMLVLAIGWSRLAMIRPENFAMLCFAALLWLIVSMRRKEQPSAGRRTMAARGRNWRLWVGVPLLMALWANLHGSFVCGLVVLACFLIGRTIEVFWRNRRLMAVLADREVHLWLGLCELGTLATLINPYGENLLFHTLWFSANDNLRDVLEWQSLTFLNVGGREFALSWVLLLVVLRHSRRRVPVAHAMLLGVFSIAAVFGVRMISWYAPIFAFVLVPHLADLASRFVKRTATQRDNTTLESTPAAFQRDFATPISVRSSRGAGREVSAKAAAAVSWKPTLTAILLVWTTFALSGLSRPLLGGDARSEGQLLGNSTPLALTEYLQAHPPRGQVFNPQWWGDWLATRGPVDFQPFMTTNIHLAPRNVWQDYQTIAFVEPGWQRSLDRYRVNTMIIDKQEQTMLASVMRQTDDWSLRYEDDQALVFVRLSGHKADMPTTSGGVAVTDTAAAVVRRAP